MFCLGLTMSDGHRQCCSRNASRKTQFMKTRMSYKYQGRWRSRKNAEKPSQTHTTFKLIVVMGGPGRFKHLNLARSWVRSSHIGRIDRRMKPLDSSTYSQVATKCRLKVNKNIYLYYGLKSMVLTKRSKIHANVQTKKNSHKHFDLGSKTKPSWLSASIRSEVILEFFPSLYNLYWRRWHCRLRWRN